ncbi:hypothetical protein ACO1M2_13760, partial [Staphylococcus aureus]
MRRLIQAGNWTAAAFALVAVCACLLPFRAAAQTQETFRRFLEEAWPEARAMGVSRRTFDAALDGVTLDL